MDEDLMEEVVKPEQYEVALAAVTRNGGAPGIDGMTGTELVGHLQHHWPVIRAKLLAGTYGPAPVRRVDIDKPSGGVRTLGIPTVLDRFIQRLLVQGLTPIFEPRFSPSSYGFRPGRSAQAAVRTVQQYAAAGQTWVVDLDIEAFFDHVHHDILMRRIAAVIRDKRVLRLIGRYLRSGIMRDGGAVATREGIPQGGPLSPLLANIYLDPLDKELAKRGHRFCRYADDCNIYVSSEAAANRVMRTIAAWITQHLRLTVHSGKSGVGRTWERKFLGFRITRDGLIEVAPQSLVRFKTRVRALWCARQSLTTKQIRVQWQRFVRGWWQYYHLAQWRRPLDALQGWLRRHMRKFFWLRWHNWRGRQKALSRLGIRSPQLRTAWSRRGAWRIAASPTLHMALDNARLCREGFLTPSDLAKENA
jgi:group II intron reverse transcriptase/maturase